MSKHDKDSKPFAGMVVHPFGPASFWAGSHTLKTFRLLGGRVGKSDNEGLTHLVTIREPLAPGAANDGSMFGSEYRDYMRTRQALGARAKPVQVISLEVFKDLVLEADAMVAARNASLRQQLNDQALRSLESGSPMAFVGL